MNFDARDTSLMVSDYPSPPDPKEHEVIVYCTIESEVTVYGDDEDSWREQIMSMNEKELTLDIRNIKVEEWEEV